MAGELRPVVEGDRLTQLGRQWSQDFGHGPGDGVCRLASQSQGNEEAGVPLVEDENRLSIGSKQHQVSLPVASRLPVSSLMRTFRNRPPVSHEGRRTAPFASPPAPFRLGPGQVVAPRVILRPGQLAVDKPVDALVGDAGPHTSVGSLGSVKHCVSTLSKSSTASDRELQQLAGSTVPRNVDGKSHTVLQW